MVSFPPEEHDVRLEMLLMLLRNMGVQECFWVGGWTEPSHHECLKEPPRNLKTWIEVVTKGQKTFGKPVDEER